MASQESVAEEIEKKLVVHVGMLTRERVLAIVDVGNKALF